MKRLFLLAVLLSSGAFAQAVTFLEINDTLQKPKYQEFVFLNNKTDLSQTVRVGRLKAVGGQDNPILLYNMIKREAQKVGANAFKLVQLDKFPDQTAELTIDAFYANDSILGVNFANIEKNNVYIFGDPNLLEKSTQSLKVNAKPYELTSGHYLRFPVLPGTNLKISKGGFAGKSVMVEGKMGQPSKFYSLTGFEVSGVDGSPNHIGVNIATGDVVQVEQNLALLLLTIFEEQ